MTNASERSVSVSSIATAAEPNSGGMSAGTLLDSI
ncbi:Uncharacterised protein [Mycobacteroides abscessus subsp. massiliense]|nr:Uncharacterised protein [Mycobacteroides abscessus subsp. massiliense]